jgi:hypothetical protein
MRTRLILRGRKTNVDETAATVAAETEKGTAAFRLLAEK